MATERKICAHCGKEYRRYPYISPLKCKTDFLGIPIENTIDFLAGYMEFCPNCGNTGYDVSKEENFPIGTENIISEVISSGEEEIAKKFIILDTIFSHVNNNLYAIMLLAFYETTGDDKNREKVSSLLIDRFEKLTKIKCSKREYRRNADYSIVGDVLILAELYRRSEEYQKALKLLKAYKRYPRMLSDSWRKFIAETELCKNCYGEKTSFS